MLQKTKYKMSRGSMAPMPTPLNGTPVFYSKLSLVIWKSMMAHNKALEGKISFYIYIYMPY